MNATELFEQLKTTVGPAYAADMVRIKFPDWDISPRKVPSIGEDLQNRSQKLSVKMGSKALHKAIWREHHPIMQTLAKQVRCNVVAP